MEDKIDPTDDKQFEKARDDSAEGHICFGRVKLACHSREFDAFAWGADWARKLMQEHYEPQIKEQSSRLAVQLGELIECGKEEEKQDALIDELVEGFKDIRKYSLGSKADTCDEMLAKVREARRQWTLTDEDHALKGALSGKVVLALLDRSERYKKALKYIDNKIKLVPLGLTHALLMLEHSKSAAQEALKEQE